MKVCSFWFRVSLAALLVLAAGCGGTAPASNQSNPTTVAPTTATPTTATPTTATPTAVAPTTTAPGALSTHVYFLRGEKVVAVHRDVLVVSAATATAAMRALLAGPTVTERAAGVTTTIPAGTQLRGVAVANDTADVDLSAAYESGGGSLSMSARLMQVVFTLTQFPTVQRVTFRLEGKAIAVFGGEGIIIDRPATRAQYESFLPEIFIESPAMGETVTSPLTVRGVANVFEGQFLVEVTDATGTVLVRAPVNASMGMHTAFTSSLRFAVETPGPGRVTGFDYSAKDGSRILDDVVPVILR
jgi:germination protein M